VSSPLLRASKACDLDKYQIYPDTPLQLQPGHEMMGADAALCFAASNPLADARGRTSGPSGVYCSSTDFHALYDYNCTDRTDSSPCLIGDKFKAGDLIRKAFSWQLKKICSVRLKDTLKADFSSALFPSDGADGTASSAW